MKKSFLIMLCGLIALAMMQAGCSSANKPKTDDVKTVATNPQDTLKTYLEVLKMEAKAFAMQQHGLYDSALMRYDICLQYLNGALANSNNKGIYLYETELIEINQGKEVIYDSIGQLGNSLKCAFESIRWAKRIGDNTMQIKFDLHTADKLKDMAAQLPNDTAKANALLREALLYAIAGTRVIDSLRTKDMDDSKYEGFHLTSEIYSLMGDKKESRLYDKKYRDVYFGIFKAQPADN